MAGAQVVDHVAGAKVIQGDVSSGRSSGSGGSSGRSSCGGGSIGRS